MARRESQIDEVASLEQRIADAEAEHSRCESQLARLSVLDPFHDALRIRLRTLETTIHVLTLRRRELPRARV